MLKTTVRCDGCNGLVRGAVSHVDGFTAGFYLRGWLRLPNHGKQTDVFPEGKNILCDFCMQSSDAYRALYGTMGRPLPGQVPALDPEPGECVWTFEALSQYIKTGDIPSGTM